MKDLIKTLINFLVYTLSILIYKNNQYWLFGSWYGQRFSDNSRYFFLYSDRYKEELGLKKIIWTTKSFNIFNELKSKGYEVYYHWSVKGIWYHLRSGVHFVDQSPTEDINAYFSIKALKINLWHGFPLKKVGIYSGQLIKGEKSFGNWHNSKVLCTSEFATEVLGEAFIKNREECIVGMYPRNHYLLNEDFQLLDSEKTIVDMIKSLKKAGKKIIFYLPTFRDKAEVKFLGTDSEEEIQKFINFLDTNNYVLITKLHYAGKLFHKESNDNRNGIINLDQDVDVYPITKETDILITDYSSIYFDFLYLDRDIIFFPYDLEYYTNIDRGLIFDYSEFTPGNKVYNLSDLEADLLNKKKFRDNYKSERNILKNKIFGNFEIADTIKEIKHNLDEK